MSFLINKCFSSIGNKCFLNNDTDTGKPMGIDPASFSVNFFLYFFKSKNIKQLISNGSSKAYKNNGVSRFIDDLFAINDAMSF